MVSCCFFDAITTCPHVCGILFHPGFTKPNSVSPIFQSLIHHLAHHNSGPRLADTLSAFDRLAKACSRLHKILETPAIAMAGPRVLSSVSLAIDISHKLTDAIEELEKHLARLGDAIEISPSLTEELTDLSGLLAQQVQRLQGIYDGVRSTQHPVLLEGKAVSGQ